MNPSIQDQQIDVRSWPPRERHSRIFALWKGLPHGAGMQLVNDHDPVPLYYQFAAEYPGEFRWEYEERGPEVWRVWIRKGDHPDPGFKPERGAKGGCPTVAPVPIEFVGALQLDVRPILAAGGSPCSAIEESVGKLIPGQSLVILSSFEPVPLYTKLGICGFSHETSRLEDGTWRVAFTPGVSAEPKRFEPCGSHGR